MQSNYLITEMRDGEWDLQRHLVYVESEQFCCLGIRVSPLLDSSGLSLATSLVEQVLRIRFRPRLPWILWSRPPVVSIALVCSSSIYLSSPLYCKPISARRSPLNLRSISGFLYLQLFDLSQFALVL